MSTSDPKTLRRKARNSHANPEDEVDGEGIFYSIMADRWDLVEDLFGGSDAMRERGERWLPKHESESKKSYENRLARSFLFPMFKETLGTLGSKPFGSPIVLVEGEKLPDRLQQIEANVDGQGATLTDWAKTVFMAGIRYGITYVMPDMPQNPFVEEEGRAANLREEEEFNLRPRFVHIHPRSLIGWKTAKDASGRVRLTQIRIKEEKVEEVGKYGEKLIEEITVWTETDIETFRKEDDDKGWVSLGSRAHSYDGIPLLPFYTNKIDEMLAEPPLWELAELNLQHWQTASDFANIMHVMRFAMVFATGVEQEEYDTVEVGPQAVFISSNNEAKFGYVEHSGEATGAGMADIEKQEERGERLGMTPLLRRQGSTTATSASINDSRATSQMESWVEAFEKFLETLYHMAARWNAGDKIPEGFTVEVFKDFDMAIRGKEDLRELRESFKEQAIDLRTYLQEIQRRGLISESVDIDEVVDKIEAMKSENMALLAGIGSDPDPDPEPGNEE